MLAGHTMLDGCRATGGELVSARAGSVVYHGNAAGLRRDHRNDRRGLPVKSTSDRTYRLAGPPAIPDLRPLSRRVINATSLFHAHTPSLGKRLECCDDQLSPPPRAVTRELISFRMKPYQYELTLVV